MGKIKYTSDIELGKKYRDVQTGYEGTATAIYFFQHACERVALERMKNDGEILSETFDSPRLECVESGRRATTDRPGGPAQRGEGKRPGP